MARQNITLAQAAKIFRVHPRTILRAISGEHNTYWSEDINDQVMAISTIADAYNMTPRTFIAVIESRDSLLTADEAAAVLGIKPRTFRDRLIAGRYKKIGRGGITRSLQSKITADLIAHTPSLV